MLFGRTPLIDVIVYDDDIPLRYYTIDFIHLTREGHAMIAAALLPQVVDIVNRRRSSLRSSQIVSGH